MHVKVTNRMDSRLRGNPYIDLVVLPDLDIMVEIEKLINARVMVVLVNREGLEKIGISENNFYAKIVGYDRIGIWIENPEFTTTRVRDDDGNIIPLEQRKQEQYLANVLIPWANLRSMVQFPERDGFSYEEDGIGSLGHGVYL